MTLAHRRSAFTLFHLLFVLAILLILIGLLLPAVAKVRSAAGRMQSSNNLKQLMLAVHNSYDTHGHLPAGIDDKNFSTVARLLPFIEQANVFNMINFDKSIDDKANAEMRAVVIKTFLSPLDPIASVNDKYGATNYLYNDQVFYLNSKLKFADITDGTSQTVALGETLKGDGKTKAEDVRRQHVALGKDALKGIKPDAGVKPFKDDKNIAGDRCASWMDGRFLQGTFNGQLRINDERPDVSCAGLGGVSALRGLQKSVQVGMLDGSVRTVAEAVSHATWKAAMTPNGGEVLGPDW
jgi:type II secretory pathway pseudopilin PulG